MGVYVDNMYQLSIGKFGRMKMSHMAADSKKELLDMATKIGLNHKWIQHEGTAYEHFDVSMSLRKKAVENGAIEVTWREMGRIINEKKQK